MTAEIVALPPGVREIGRQQTPRELAIERCADQIERAMRGKLTIHQRIGLERALDELVDEIAWRHKAFRC